MAHRTPRSHPRLAGVCLLISTSTASFADSSATIAELVATLDASQLTLRESATADLIDRTDELAAAIGNGVIPSALSIEQRSRVGEILRQRFLLSPRAGLGVQFRELPGQGLTTGVNIAAVVPGFAAAGLLQPNDIVIRAEGQPLVDQPRSKADASFRFAILSLNPGETIHLTVLRAGEELDIEIPMGSYSDLANGMPPDSRLLDGAWRLRAQRMGLAVGQIERLGLNELDHWVATYKPRRDVPGMLPGGRPKGVSEAEHSIASLAKVNTNERSVTRTHLAAAAQLRELETRMAAAITRQRDLRKEAETVDPEGDEFQRLQSQIQRVQQELAIIERQHKETVNRLGPSKRIRNGAGR